MSLLKKIAGVWTFVERENTKHPGEALDLVAQQDPGYLSWAWRNPYTSMEEFHAITDAAERHGIDVAKDKKKANQKFRKQRITVSKRTRSAKR